MNDKRTDGMRWEGFMPTLQHPQHLQVYDLRGAARDTNMMATILAGLLNRPQPRIYLIINDDDAFWLLQSFGAVPQSRVAQTGENAFTALLDTYHEAIQGLIVYDPALLDTINIATTMAGPRNALVVAPSAVPALQDNYGLSVVEDLRTYGWKSRVQAYRWAWEHLLSSSTGIIAGLDPQAFCGLRSLLVATNAFVYWLDSRPRLADLCWWNPSERRLLQRLYRSRANNALHLGWFIHEPSGVALTSQSAIAVVASDFCTNLEVWTAFQISPPSLKSSSPPASDDQPAQLATTDDLPGPQPSPKKIYLSFTMSDGDNVQYCQHRLLHLWQDPARGSLPIGWTLAPALLQVAPAMARYYLSTTSDNDELIAGPSGAGYLFPSNWPRASLESLVQQTGALMQAMGMTTIEILDTDALYKAGLPLVSRVSLRGMAFTDTSVQRQFVHDLIPYGLRGVLSGAGFWLSKPRWQFIEQVPLYRNLGLADTVERALWLIRRAASSMPERPLFLNLYVIAWSMGPTQLKQVVESLGEEYEVVLPRQLLARLSALQPDNQRSA
jgi:hypothetical protein